MQKRDGPGPQPGIRNGGCKIIGRGVWGPLKAPSGSRAKPWQGGQGAKPPGSSRVLTFNKKNQNFVYSCIFFLLNVDSFARLNVTSCRKYELFYKEIVSLFFFLKRGCTCTCGTPPGYGLVDLLKSTCNITHTYFSLMTPYQHDLNIKTLLGKTSRFITFKHFSELL